VKIAVFSDIHDNLVRWREEAKIIEAEKIKIGICCGDIGDLPTIEEVAKSFEILYLVLGNLDYHAKKKTALFPDNIKFTLDYGDVELEGKKIAFTHNQHFAKKLAESSRYDIVFYGHTHTPWEEKIGNTILLNPGEIAGQFGRASFAIYDLKNMKAELKILS